MHAQKIGAVVAVAVIASLVLPAYARTPMPHEEVRDNFVVGALGILSLGFYPWRQTRLLARRCDDINYSEPAPVRRWYHFFREKQPRAKKLLDQVIPECEDAPGCGFDQARQKCKSTGVKKFMSDMDDKCGQFNTRRMCALPAVRIVCKWESAADVLASIFGDASLVSGGYGVGNCKAIRSSSFRSMGGLRKGIDQRLLGVKVESDKQSITPSTENDPLAQSYAVEDCADFAAIKDRFPQLLRERVDEQYDKYPALADATLQRLCEVDKLLDSDLPVVAKVKKQLRYRYILRLAEDVAAGMYTDLVGNKMKIDALDVFYSDLTYKQKMLYMSDENKWEQGLREATVQTTIALEQELTDMKDQQEA